MEKLKECHYQAKQSDDQRRCIVQQIMQKNTDFFRRVTVPVGGQGMSHHRARALVATDTRWKITFGASRCGTENQCNWWCRRAAACTIGGTRTEVLAIQDSAHPSESKAFRAHAMRARIPCALSSCWRTSRRRRQKFAEQSRLKITNELGSSSRWASLSSTKRFT